MKQAGSLLKYTVEGKGGGRDGRGEKSSCNIDVKDQSTGVTSE